MKTPPVLPFREIRALLIWLFLQRAMGDDQPDMEKEYPHLDAWLKRMLQMKNVQKVLEERGKALAAATLPPGY